MNCKNCKNILTKDDQFCTNCGVKVFKEKSEKKKIYLFNKIKDVFKSHLLIKIIIGFLLIGVIAFLIYQFVFLPKIEKKNLLLGQMAEVELQLDNVLEQTDQCSHARLIKGIGSFDLNSDRYKKAIQDCASLYKFSEWVLDLVVEPELNSILPPLDKLKNDVDEFSIGVTVEERTDATWSGNMDELIKKDVRDVKQKLYNLRVKYQ